MFEEVGEGEGAPEYRGDEIVFFFWMINEY